MQVQDPQFLKFESQDIFVSENHGICAHTLCPRKQTKARTLSDLWVLKFGVIFQDPSFQKVPSCVHMHMQYNLDFFFLILYVCLKSRERDWCYGTLD